MTTERRKLGNTGEEAACMFLMKHGFQIIERNYLRKWSEIDIVAKKGGVFHFVEVKSASLKLGRVSPDLPTGREEHRVRPEENMHPQKIARLNRAIQTYLIEKNINEDWQLDLVIVVIDKVTRSARVEILENII